MPGQLVVQATALCLRDLVVRVGTTDLVSPLHLIRLDNECANLRLAVDGRSERDNKVSSIFTIRLQKTILWLAGELSCGAFSEEGGELALLLDVVGESERHT